MLASDASGSQHSASVLGQYTTRTSRTDMTGSTQQVSRDNSYFLSRLKSLGLSLDQAPSHGLDCDDEGAILQYLRNFKGEHRMFVPEAMKKTFLKIQNRKTGTEIHDSHFYRRLAVRRIHPDALARDPRLHKYMNERGEKVYPLPSNLAIKNYCSNTQGGTIAFIEGYFKAVAMSLSGIEAVAFTGISVYRLSDELTDYISTRRPENILVMYDADALDVTSGKLLSSRRQEDFMNSIDKFSQELFTLFERIDLDCSISFVMGRPDMKGKGVDDLMEEHGAKVIADDIKSFPITPKIHASNFFSGFKLSTTTRRERLRKLFLGKNYREWVEKHLNHPEKDLAKGFRFCKAQYKISSAGSLLDNTNTYKLETDPFAVDLSSEELTVRDYLDRQRLRLDQILQEKDRVAIQAPTGSGKTTFFCEYAKRKSVPIVLTVPTVSLAKQVAKEHGGYALHGNYKVQKIQAANESRIIVCTYDTLGHVPDLWRRLLVIDEAHNLVNQYGETYRVQRLFRAEALRKCLAIVQQHKKSGGKTVLISGTMPDLLCYALECHLVKIHRSLNPKVRVFDIEAEQNNNASLSKSLLTRMAEINWSVKKLNVVFWNNSQQIENLKATLVEMGLLPPEQIVIISRRHYNAGETEGLDDIIKKQKLGTEVRLMLCTCLISEGINIKNENVGRIYAVGIKCPATFRQFVARFRKLDVVNVFSILPPERDLKSEFFFPAQFELEENIERAELQAKHLLRREIYWNSEYDEDELAFIKDIERSINYEYDNQIMNLIYKEDGEWKVDILNVLARIRGRQIATANNCYLYTQLANAGFDVIRIEDMEVKNDVEDAVNQKLETEKVEKQRFSEQLAEDLSDDPVVLINALYLYYKDKGDRHGTARLRKFVGDLINEDSVEAIAWLHLNRRRFDKKSRGLVTRIAKLIFLGVDDPTPFMKMSQAEWSRHLKSTIFYFECQAMDSRGMRKQLRPAHKEEIRLKKAIGKLIAKAAGKTVSPADLVNMIQPLVKVKKFDPEKGASAIDILALSPAQMVRLVTETTQSCVKGNGRDRSVNIGEMWSPKCPPLIAGFSTEMKANPLKILDFLGG